MKPSIKSPRHDQSSGLNLRRNVETFAIQYALSELMKMLQSVTPKRQIDARNRMDIPHGMFSLSLKMFFERRAIKDIAYLDALRIVCPIVLQNAKNCIVLDDIHDLISQLATGHKADDMRQVLTEIEQSKKLLGIHDDICKDRNRNTKEHMRLHETLKEFDSESRRKLRALDLKKDITLIEAYEEKQLIDPIEFRYIKSMKGSFQNCKYEFIKKEEELNDALAKALQKQKREIQCSISVRMKLEFDIKDFKRRLNEMEDKYFRDVDEVNSRVGYIQNSIELLESKKRDCRAKLIMFAEEMPVLQAWFEELERKKTEKRREEFHTMIAEKKAKKEKKKK